MAQPYNKNAETVAGGCRAKDVHDEMRTDKYQNDIGDADLEGEKKDELMRPGTGEDVEG